jgi:hypothetical protein
VFRPDSSALFAVSARKGPEGSILLYEVEGPGAGKWTEKGVELNTFRNQYHVVDEDEGIAIRNLVPANVPVGDIRLVNVTYPIALLSSAVIAVADSFPTASEVDPVKLVEQQQKMLDGTLLGIILTTEAIDIAGATYDAIRIGKNALNLIRETAIQMLIYLDGIRKLISQSTDLASVRKATAFANAFMAQAPLWGLYLNRVYLWTQLSDLTEMTGILRDARQFDGAMAVVLRAIDGKRDFLLNQGISPEAMSEAKAYAETVLRNANAKGLDTENEINAYRAQTGTSARKLERAVFEVGKQIDFNTARIKEWSDGKSVKASGNGALGDYFIGVFGQLGQLRRALPEPVDAVRVARAAMSPEARKNPSVPGALRAKVPGLFDAIVALAYGGMTEFSRSLESLKKKKVTVASQMDAIAGINQRIAAQEKKIREFKEQGLDAQKLEVATNELLKMERALRVAQANSAYHEENHIENYLSLQQLHQGIGDKLRAKGHDVADEAARVLVVHLLNDVNKNYVYLELDTPVNRANFFRLMLDFQQAFSIPHNLMNLIVHKLVSRTIPSKPGVAVLPQSKEKTQETLGLLYEESKALLEAEYQKLSQVFSPDIVKTIYVAMTSHGRLLEEMRSEINSAKPQGVFASMNREQIQFLKEFLSPDGNPVRMRQLIEGLEGNLKWPEGVMTAISTEWKSFVKEPAEKLREHAKVIKGFKARLLNLQKDPPADPLAIPSLEESIKKEEAVLKENLDKYRESGAVARILSALERHNEEVDLRRKAAKEALENPSSPEVKAAAEKLSAASKNENPEALKAGVSPTQEEQPPGAPTPEEIIKVESAATKEAEILAADLEILTTADSVTEAAAGSDPPGGPGTPGGIIYPEPPRNPDRVGPTNNVVPERVSNEAAGIKGAGTGIKKTLVGLGAAVAIAALLGLGAALSGRATPDPKSTDPIVPPPVSNVETALKIGGVVVGGALLLYLLFGRRQESKTPAKAQLKR